MAQVTYDESRWPLVVVTWGHGESTDENALGLVQKLEAYLQRGDVFAVVLDSRAGIGVSAKQRRMFADFIEQNAMALRARAKIAFVLSTAVQRAMVTAVGWLAPANAEQKAFARIDDAIAWCHDRMDLSSPGRSVRASP